VASRKLRSSLLVAAALMLAAASLSAGQKPLKSRDFAVAGVKPSMSQQRVQRELGPPQAVEQIQHPTVPEYLYTRWNYPDLQVTFAPDGQLTGIMLRTQTHATRRGLRVGDSRDRVLELYGAPHSLGSPAWDYLESREPSGQHLIRVEFVDDRVASIYLGWLAIDG